MVEPGRIQGFPVILAAVLVGALAGILGPGCLERREDAPASSGGEGRCASCHGDPLRSGDFLRRAAPPRTLAGATEPSDPAVGAHDLHLDPSSTHGAIACAECHRVPENVHSEGHIGGVSPADIAFGALARTGDRKPLYDSEARACSDTSCHRDSTPVWNEPRPSDEACGSCHALPPAAPHPASDRCSACHGDVIDADRRFVAPGLHVNGAVDVSYPPESCGLCHGSDDDPAPPRDTRGGTDRSARGVGAHQVHLGGGVAGRPLACGECHAVPGAVDAPDHVNGLPAEVVLTGVGRAGGRDGAHYDVVTGTCADTWCHGPGRDGAAESPTWTAPGALGCTGCHAAPPAAPHPQMSDCSRCHAGVAADDITFADRSRHIDGRVDVAPPEACNACHGGVDDPAPPPDLSGGSASGAAGVGAHTAHVRGTPRSRPVACTSCHSVPTNLLDAGHIDTPLPAEVTLGGSAATWGGTPRYEAGTCRDTSCHGARFPDGHASGGAHLEPSWTEGAVGAPCGSCHGLPPPAPHPYGNLNPVCSKCHENIADDNRTFLRPELHVDGQVTFTVP